MRVVIDTNVWVSALLNPHGFPARILQAFRDRQFEVVVSHTLLTELRSVLRRPRILRKYQISEGVRIVSVQQFLDILTQATQ
jgi:putative PIN family toxin of toxin-antitoxin system